MWFLRWQTRDKNCKYKNTVELVLRSFNLKNKNRKIWVVKVFTAGNYDVNLVELYILHFL